MPTDHFNQHGLYSAHAQRQTQLIERLTLFQTRLSAAKVSTHMLEQIEGALAKWEHMLSVEETQSASAISAAAVSTNENELIQIWCDGSCSPNPGPGGWGALIDQGGQRIEISGFETYSTNNRMELTAALEALRHTPAAARVMITADSRYLIEGITRWVEHWKQRGWHRKDGKPVLNQDLWQALDTLTATRTVDWQWLKAHAGHPENERCDQLANQARQNNTALTIADHSSR